MDSDKNVSFTWKHFLSSCDFFSPYILSQNPVLSFCGLSHLLSAVDKKMILFHAVIRKEKKIPT